MTIKIFLFLSFFSLSIFAETTSHVKIKTFKCQQNKSKDKTLIELETTYDLGGAGYKATKNLETTAVGDMCKILDFIQKNQYYVTLEYSNKKEDKKNLEVSLVTLDSIGIEPLND